MPGKGVREGGANGVRVMFFSPLFCCRRHKPVYLATYRLLQLIIIRISEG